MRATALWSMLLVGCASIEPGTIGDCRVGERFATVVLPAPDRTDLALVVGTHDDAEGTRDVIAEPSRGARARRRER